MSTIYLDEQGSEVKKKGELLIIEKDDKTIAEIPLAQLDRMVIIGNIQITTPALALLLDNEIPVEVTQKYSLITLNFITPARIIVNEDLVVDLEFHHLIRSLLSRISTLSYFHHGKRMEIDFKGLIERASRIRAKERNTKWYDWERYSAKQDTKMKMGGFIGKVTFEGDLNEFLPFIRLGEIIHAGKGTSFGLGKYEIMEGE